MKTLARTLLIAATLAVPAVSFAQSVDNNGPLTRAEVRADLVRVEKAGFHVGPGQDGNYPVDIQRAEAKIAAQDRVVALGTSAQPQASGFHLMAQHYRIDDSRSVYTDGA